MVEITNLVDNKMHFILESIGPFSVIEHVADLSVTADTAMREYFMREMGVRRRQLMIKLVEKHGVVVQKGAMQWMAGNIQATAGVKGAGDLIGKTIRGMTSNDSIIKPEYQGNGVLMLEPTYKHILLEDVSTWNGGLVMEDGMFLASTSGVEQRIQARRTVSSAVLGKEKLCNLKLVGNGLCALESTVPRSEIIEVVLRDDVLKIDGSFAICWSGNLGFTVERAGKTLIGSYASGEGLVNTYSGTGKIWLSPLSPTDYMRVKIEDQDREKLEEDEDYDEE